jgi:L-xylulose reductase
MVERKKGGAIVNISSAASLQGLDDHAVYCSTKAAVDKLTHVMALELGKYKVLFLYIKLPIACTYFSLDLGL